MNENVSRMFAILGEERAAVVLLQIEVALGQHEHLGLFVRLG